MRILLDECLPRKLKTHLLPHEALTVPEMGWSGVKNGSLLRLAETKFDVFVTVDRNLPYQQNLGTYHIAVVVLVTPRNRLKSLLPLVPPLLSALDPEKLPAGTLLSIAG